MDTKQKPRSAAPSGKRRPAAKNTSGARQRAADTSRRKQGAAQRPRTQGAVRTADQTARRQNTAPRNPAPSARRSESTAQQVKSSAPEMVFKPTPQQSAQPRDPEKAQREARRRRSAQRVKARKEQKRRQQNRPEVVYTQPKPINVNRLLLQIAVVMAVVLAVVVGLSVFFKVETVVVYGNEAYSAWTVQEASGIEGGENLLTLSTTRACGQITAALPYVENVRIGIKLPDTVNIYIEEIDVAYAIESQNGTWWLMTSDGNMVEQIDGGTAGNYTKVLGVYLDNPAEGEPAKAADQIAEEVEATEETAETTAEGATEAMEPPVALVTGQDRLAAALLILSALERNDIVGEAASVDVTSLSNIELWYGTQYQVKLGDTSDMEYKISCMKKAVAQRKEYDMGILDVSFITWPDQVGFTPTD